MSMRNVIKNLVVTTVKYNNVFETAIINSFGRTIRSTVSFTEAEARQAHFKMCSLCR